MEAKALKKFIRSSPRKMRLVVDLIRGKNAAEAMALLKFSTKLASRDIEMVLRSALSNLSNAQDGKSLNNEEVIVKRAYVDCGPMMKRIRPAPMGRAYRVRKRSNHLTIVVSTQD
ncbi:MAG: 50S ribosomal protein L22 [Bacteroidota bacterium]|jgi:large subunit ribosomal protein L22